MSSIKTVGRRKVVNIDIRSHRGTSHPKQPDAPIVILSPSSKKLDYRFYKELGPRAATELVSGCGCFLESSETLFTHNHIRVATVSYTYPLQNCITYALARLSNQSSLIVIQ